MKYSSFQIRNLFPGFAYNFEVRLETLGMWIRRVNMGLGHGFLCQESETPNGLLGFGAQQVPLNSEIYELQICVPLL